MKFNINKLLAVLAVASLGVACNKEQLQDEIPSSGNGTVEVVVSIDNGTRSFSDAEGVKWEVGDQIKYAGEVELTSEPLTDKQITDNGYKASFTFDKSLIEADRTGWFCSTKCHPTNYTEVEFTLGKDNGNLFTQAKAGQMNSRYLFLHSGTGMVNITKGVAPEVKMEIAGTIFRVIPYTTKYNDEKILSVKLSSKTNLVGTVSYDRSGGTYRGVNDINWKSYNYVKANLGTPFSLQGITSAETSKGIYLAVAATPEVKPLDGYKYEVETDKATYVFNAMTEKLAVRNNFVKNVYLNLDKATSRVEGAGSNKKLTFFGGIGDTTIEAVKVENKDLGFCAIDVDGVHAEDWKGNSHNEAELYGSVTITPYVDRTGVGASATVADWLTVGYGKDSEGKINSTHIFVTAQDNTGAERKSLVYCVYKAPEGYEFAGGQKEVYKQFFVTQKSGLTVEAAFSGFPTEAVAAAGGTVKGKLSLTVNGEPASDIKSTMSTYGLSLSVNKGATATVDASGNVEVVIPENKYKNGGVEYTLSLKKSDGTVAASFVITQEEGTEEVTTVKYTYTLTKNNGNASGAIWGMNVNAKNGDDFTITDVKLNDQPVTLDEVSAAAVLAQAIKCLPEKPAAGYHDYTVIDNGQIYINVVNFSGSTLNAGVATTDSSQRYITKLVWYDSDGTEAGNWFIFVP